MAKRRQNKARSKKLEVRIESKKRTNQADGSVILEERIDDDVEKEKKMFMWVGVSCVMVVLAVVWIFNLKYQFNINSDYNNKSNFSWGQTKAELDKAMLQLKQGLAEIKQVSEQEQNALPQESEITSEQIDLLKEKLMNETLSSTTASGTIKN